MLFGTCISYLSSLITVPSKNYFNYALAISMFLVLPMYFIDFDLKSE